LTEGQSKASTQENRCFKGPKSNKGTCKEVGSDNFEDNEDYSKEASQARE
jgi:hypothetical protein